MKKSYFVYIYNNDYARITKKEYDRLIKKASEELYNVRVHVVENNFYLSITLD